MHLPVADPLTRLTSGSPCMHRTRARSSRCQWSLHITEQGQGDELGRRVHQQVAQQRGARGGGCRTIWIARRVYQVGPQPTATSAEALRALTLVGHGRDDLPPLVVCSLRKHLLNSLSVLIGRAVADDRVAGIWGQNGECRSQAGRGVVSIAHPMARQGWDQGRHLMRQQTLATCDAPE